MLLSASRAVTVKFPATPAVLGLGNPATVSELAAAAFTVMAFEVPVIVAFPVSVAVIVWLPRVFKVAERTGPAGQSGIRPATPPENPCW